ncbi:MAG: hypothetical protein KKE20_05545 [Nanoarchaeota archaeon]|nr:hypothetical protein [Nanoarchaeota archaeon]
MKEADKRKKRELPVDEEVLSGQGCGLEERHFQKLALGMPLGVVCEACSHSNQWNFERLTLVSRQLKKKKAVSADLSCRCGEPLIMCFLSDKQFCITVLPSVKRID